MKPNEPRLKDYLKHDLISDLINESSKTTKGSLISNIKYDMSLLEKKPKSCLLTTSHDQISKLINNTVTTEVQSNKSNKPNGELNIFISSWNMAGVDMNNSQNLLEWLYPVKDMNPPDIYVIGFQEIVELVFSNMITSNATVVYKYRTLLINNLSKIGK